MSFGNYVHELITFHTEHSATISNSVLEVYYT
jgi:hypothetical protein